jgi:hypothetical protein
MKISWGRGAKCRAVCGGVGEFGAAACATKAARRFGGIHGLPNCIIDKGLEALRRVLPVWLNGLTGSNGLSGPTSRKAKVSQSPRV